MRLTKYEMETIIRFNEEEAEAVCDTCNKSLMRRLDGLSEKSSTVTVVSASEYSRTYKFPKRWIRVQMPRVLTEEERQKLSERARLNFGKNTKEE